MPDYLFDCIVKLIGRTITVYTASGGLSGAGFTGVLIGAERDWIELHCAEAEPPACPIGSGCTGYVPSQPELINPLGAVVRIEICAIVAYAEHAI